VRGTGVMHDPEQVNAVKCQPLDGDDHPTQITAYQAQKCAAIVEAYADGQALYREHVNTVAKFLKTAALEAALGHGYSRPTAQTIWQHIEHLPWPRHGGARRQAEL